MLLVDTISPLTLQCALHSSEPLAAEIVSVRSKWSRVCNSNLKLKDAFKNFLILFCSAAFDVFLKECHSVMHATGNPPTSATPQRDSDDVYLCFGGATLAAMLHLRYDKNKEQKNESVSQIAILQRLNLYTKEHIPEYLQYRDNGYMYFPCKEMLTFLIAVYLRTKEMANDQSF